jgi:hypothetical protein
MKNNKKIEKKIRVNSCSVAAEILSGCADDLRFSTASGSERGFRKGFIDGSSLATARGTDPSAPVKFFPMNDSELGACGKI